MAKKKGRRKISRLEEALKRANRKKSLFSRYDAKRYMKTYGLSKAEYYTSLVCLSELINREYTKKSPAGDFEIINPHDQAKK